MFRMIFFERIWHSQRYRPLKRYTSATFIQVYACPTRRNHKRGRTVYRRKTKENKEKEVGEEFVRWKGDRSITGRRGIAPSNNNGEISFEWKEEREASEEACRSAIPRARNVSWWTWRGIDNRSRATKARRT